MKHNVQVTQEEPVHCASCYRFAITNEEWAAKRSNVSSIVTEVKRRRWNWLGHVLRMEKSRLPLKVLNWTPLGKRKPGRPKGTWRRTVDQERWTKQDMALVEMGYTGPSWLAQTRGCLILWIELRWWPLFVLQAGIVNPTPNPYPGRVDWY